MAKPEIKPLTSRGTSEVLFERYIISERDYDVSIIVNEAEECALIIKDGLLLETVEGGKYYIFEKNELKKNITQVEVIFLSKKTKIPLDWGTRSQISFVDSVYNLPVKLGFNGMVEVQVGNPRKFYSEIVGRDVSFDKSNLKARISEDIPHYIKQSIAEYMEKNKISYLEIEQVATKLSNEAFLNLAEKFVNEYGIKLNKFFISGAIMDNACNKALLYKKLEIEKDEEKIKEDYRLAIEEEKRAQERRVKEQLLQNSIKCKYCGTNLPKEANFCFNCGKNIKEIDIEEFEEEVAESKRIAEPL